MTTETPVHWIGSAKKDLLSFPETVIGNLGYALGVAQLGEKHPAAKAWKGEGPGVFEIVEDFDGDTFRLLYTVRLADAVYVLHAFQKKSPKGIATAARDIAVVKQRLKAAREDHESRRATRKD